MDYLNSDLSFSNTRLERSWHHSLVAEWRRLDKNWSTLQGILVRIKGPPSFNQAYLVSNEPAPPGLEEDMNAPMILAHSYASPAGLATPLFMWKVWPLSSWGTRSGFAACTLAFLLRRWVATTGHRSAYERRAWWVLVREVPLLLPLLLPPLLLLSSATGSAESSQVVLTGGSSMRIRLPPTQPMQAAPHPAAAHRHAAHAGG